MGLIRAVFFDIDDTLFSTTEFAHLARRNAIDAIRRMGVNLTREQLLKELNEVISEFTSNYERHFDKLLLRIPKRCYEGLNPAILVASAVVAYHKTKYTNLKPYYDAKVCLKKLLKTDLIRGIITAGWEIKQAEKILRLDLYKYLTRSAIFISDQIGISKPNPKLFLRACYEAGITPSETVYVGNSLEKDIDPANKAGMISVYLCRKRKNKAKSDIKPRYEISNLTQLLDILKKDYKVKGL